MSADDALARGTPLPHAVEFPVLGVRTRFRTNSAAVLAIVGAVFGAWDGRVQGTDVVAESGPGPLDVRVVVHDDGGAPVDGSAPVRHVCPDATRVIAYGAGGFALSDPSRREAFAYVSPALLADAERFRDAMLEAITLALVSHFDRHPLHAAGIAHGDRAVLLAGPSGSGKSTLAYAAHAAGLAVLGDDHVWVQREPHLRVWGWPRSARLLPDAATHFGDASRAPRAADGSGKLLVPLRGLAEIDRCAVDRAVVCVLARGDGPPTLAPLAPDAVVAALSARVDPGFDRFPERHHAVASALAAGGGWCLRLSDDPRAALPSIRRMLELD